MNVYMDILLTLFLSILCVYGHMCVCVCVCVGMHAHAHKSTFPPTWAMGHTRSLIRSWKVMDGHERSWSWTCSWKWACPCPCPWNRQTHMRVEKYSQTPPSCWIRRRTDIFFKRSLKSSDTPPEVNYHLEKYVRP